MLSSLLTTAGDVVFAGEASGEFDGFDARTGELLWQFQTGYGIHGSPMTYSVSGKQYVAEPTGWGEWIKGFAPELYGAPRVPCSWCSRCHSRTTVLPDAAQPRVETAAWPDGRWTTDAWHRSKAAS